MYCFLLFVVFASCTERSDSGKDTVMDLPVEKNGKKDSILKTINLKALVTHETYTDAGPGFEHFVLIENFSVLDMDSSIMVGLAAKYRDTASFPTNILRFYSSDKGFVSNEKKHNTKKINRNCVLAIIFGARYNSRKYIFYDKKGNITYEGSEWKK